MATPDAPNPKGLQQQEPRGERHTWGLDVGAQGGERLPKQEIRGEAVRDFMINDAILEKYGLTRGCDGCTAKAAGRTARRGHSKDCRSRIEEEMRKTGDEGG